MVNTVKAAYIVFGAVVLALLIMVAASSAGFNPGELGNDGGFGNEAPDKRAAISFVLLCTQDAGAPDVGGQGSDECDEGEPFVRWEWNGNSFVAEGASAGTTMTASDYKDSNEPIEADWTSEDFDVTAAVVGAGGETCDFGGDPGSLPDSGTVSTCD